MIEKDYICKEQKTTNQTGEVLDMLKGNPILYRIKYINYKHYRCVSRQVKK